MLMFDLLGGLPLIVRLIGAIVVVLALIGGAAWLLRRFGPGNLGGAAARGRQPRLAVIEAGAVDGRRKLVIVRRDNVEHLIMIGGPTDILIEANIVRGQAATRDAPAARGAAAAATATTTATEPATSWPLAPEPGTPRSRPAALEESLSWSLPAEPQVAMPPAPPPAPRRPTRTDALAGLANELSRPASGLSEPAVTAPRTAPTLDIPATRSTGPILDIPMPKLDMPAPKPSAPQPQAPAPSEGDQNLSEMAQRLEAALRRPGGSASAPAAPAKPASPAPTVSINPPVNPSLNPSLASAPRIDSLNGARDKAAKPEPAAKPDEGGAAFGSLEQEMANLLGRPTNKQ
jgi:flagellar protein FliO/FliZ